MSDCSMRLKPRIDEPSNISSLSSAFSSSSTGIETFLTWPYGSVNCSRTKATLSRRQRSSTSCLSMTLLGDRLCEAQSLSPGRARLAAYPGISERPQTTCGRPACITSRPGVRPVLRATPWERTLAGRIKAITRSMPSSRARSIDAAAASVA